MVNLATKVWKELLGITTPSSIAFFYFNREIEDFGFWDTLSMSMIKVTRVVTDYLERHNDIQIL